MRSRTKSGKRLRSVLLDPTHSTGFNMVAFNPHHRDSAIVEQGVPCTGSGPAALLPLARQCSVGSPGSGVAARMDRAASRPSPETANATGLPSGLAQSASRRPGVVGVG